MKKLSYFLSISAMIALVTFASCKKDETDPVTEDDGVPCADKTYPESTGDALVEITNYNTIETVGSTDFTAINAQVGDQLNLNLLITKGSFKTTKVRMYYTDCINELGTIASVAGQEKANNAGTEIDLRNIETPQNRAVIFTVPSGMDPVYVTIEVDQSDGKNTHERILIHVSNSGVIDEYTGILMGAQDNANPSRLIAGTGETFTSCDAAASISLVDITYANGNADTKHYLASNYSRFQAASPFYVGTSTTITCTEGTVSIGPGTQTSFKGGVTGDYDNATDATLSAVSFTGAAQYVEVSNVGDVVLFKNAKGKVGVAKVTALSAPSGSGTNEHTGTVTLSVKIQR